jgi:hypothetical protein
MISQVMRPLNKVRDLVFREVAVALVTDEVAVGGIAQMPVLV